METKFWNRMLQLCQEKNTTPTAVAKEIGLSNSISVRWKQGSIPNKATLQKIADYFETTTDDLLGYNQSHATPKTAKQKELFDRIDRMTDDELDDLEDILNFVLKKRENK